MNSHKKIYTKSNKDSKPYKDYRLLQEHILKKDFELANGQVMKAGETIQLMGSALYDGKNIIAFPIPSMTALFLAQAYDDWISSQHFLTDEKFSEILTPENSKIKIISPKEDFIFFTLLQSRMVAIVFSYTALESFANENIPDKYVFRRKRDDNKCIEEYNKQQTERLSLDIKLHEVLPEILKITSPKQTKIWTKYMLLKGLRDRIIHMKSRDKETFEPNDKTIWNELLNSDHPNFALEVKDIIGYFLEKSPTKPRWYKEFWKE